MHNKHSILVVNDETDSINTLTNLLKEYTLISLKDKTEIIDKLAEDGAIDLILLDTMTHNIDGFEICRLLKENPKTTHIPVIFLSAKNKPSDIQMAFEAGGVDYIIKPFNPNELLSRVNTHLKLRAYEKNLESRVQEEIQKNKINEQMIFQQSKQAALGELLMHIAYQWKQPLASLESINNLMKKKFQSDTVVSKDEYLKSIKRSEDIIEFIEETIETFKKFYTPSADNKEFFLADAVIDILTIIEGTFYFDDIKIYILSHEKEPVYGNVNEFSQVIFAILNNSREVLKQREIFNPEIRIEIENKKITIMDNGGGIQDKSFEDIFLPSLGTKNSSGVSLYLAKVLVEKNSGVITASNGKDGAVFTIEFLTWID
ncbi:hybrid sensor histidine kinase/response regulator [Sulfurimonas sp.]|uniref:hybrid sensor histidine kinase/response regulator n=1 Tax=Sulfurimonas sp. TaxID=2022749 RepID=UPI0019E30F72|nr:hybrid sensor histidine kinase/response regulator [Sulfurimonas sp.]MBE0513845.1 hybrid sensor histidine kinase/response regulator [Sulfurimonas sp.]